MENENEVKFFCVLAGGFIYLFETIESEMPKYYLPLKYSNLEIIKNFNDENVNGKFRFKVEILRDKNLQFLKNKSDRIFYEIGFEKIDLMENWVKVIKDRKNQIESLKENKRIISN